jgi:multiple sugar transport system permease protein
MALTNRFNRTLLHVLIIIGIVTMLYPVLWMISSSFKPSDQIFTHMGLWPREFTFQHSSRVGRECHERRSLRFI